MGTIEGKFQTTDGTHTAEEPSEGIQAMLKTAQEVRSPEPERAVDEPVHRAPKSLPALDPIEIREIGARLVFVYPMGLPARVRDTLHDMLERSLGVKVLVVDGGPKIYDLDEDERLKALEEKVAAQTDAIQALSDSLQGLTEALDGMTAGLERLTAGGDDEDPPQHDLEGRTVAMPREPGTPL